jgi:hypothetical protein
MKQTVCDRCHGQKLRCDRDDSGSESCRRCRKVGAICTYPRYTGSPSTHPEESSRDTIRQLMYSDSEAHSQGKQPPNKMRRISPSQGGASSETLAGTSILSNDREPRSPSAVPDLHDYNISPGTSASQENPPLPTPAFYDGLSLASFGFTNSEIALTDFGKQLSTNASLGTHPSHQSLLDAWPSMARAMPMPSSDVSLGIEQATPFDLRRQRLESMESEFDFGYDAKDLLTNVEHRGVASSIPSTPTSFGAVCNASAAQTSIQGSLREKSSKGEDAGASRWKEEQLCQLYSRLATSLDTTNSGRASMMSAFQQTTILVNIIRTFTKFYGLDTPLNRSNMDRHDSGTVTSIQLSSCSLPDNSGQTSGVVDNIAARKQARIANASTIDNGSVFLILACYSRLMSFYQNLVDKVVYQFNTATRSGRLADGNSNMDNTQCEETTAMEWVQTACSVTHLAEKLNSAMQSLLTRDLDEDVISISRSASNSMHRNSESPNIYGTIPCATEDPGELDELFARLLGQVYQTRARLKNSVDDVTMKIKGSDLL